MANFRFWPSTSGPGSNTTDGSSYTMGLEFTVSQAVTLQKIWFWTATGATVLPVAVAVYQETGGGSTGTIVEQNTSPTWSGSAGSAQWISVTMSGTTTLSPGNTYKAVFLKDTNANVYSATANYWSSGAGSSGLSSGPLTAPNNGSAAGGGQDTFVTPSSSLTYPNSSFNATNYWVDVEVATTGGGPAGTVPPLITVLRRTAARVKWLGTVVRTTNAPPPPVTPFTATSDAIPGKARPGFTTPGNPLAPVVATVAVAAPQLRTFRTEMVPGRGSSRIIRR